MLNYYAIFPKSLLLNIIYCKQYLCTTVVIIWGFSNFNFFNPFKWQNLAIKLSAKPISDVYSLAYCESKDVYTFGININPMFMYRWEAVSVHNESLVRCNLHFEHFYWVFCENTYLISWHNIIIWFVAFMVRYVMSHYIEMMYFCSGMRQFFSSVNDSVKYPKITIR